MSYLHSKLKLIKYYLHSIMLQESLSNFAILSIEKDLFSKLEYKNLISDLAFQKARNFFFNNFYYLFILVKDH